MGMFMEGDAVLVARLQNIAERLPARAATRLKKAAIEIRDIARRMAPRDMGNLEDAIKVDQLDGTGERSEETGKFQRKEFVVFVDESHPAEGRKAGTLVGQYAVFMHEGDYRLGLESLQKQMADGEFEVGPKFLERAVEHVEKDLMKEMIEATFGILDLDG